MQSLITAAVIISFINVCSINGQDENAILLQQLLTRLSLMMWFGAVPVKILSIIQLLLLKKLMQTMQMPNAKSNSFNNWTHQFDPSLHKHILLFLGRSNIQVANHQLNVNKTLNDDGDNSDKPKRVSMEVSEFDDHLNKLLFYAIKLRYPKTVSKRVFSNESHGSDTRRSFTSFENSDHFKRLISEGSINIEKRSDKSFNYSSVDPLAEFFKELLIETSEKAKSPKNNTSKLTIQTNKSPYFYISDLHKIDSIIRKLTVEHLKSQSLIKDFEKTHVRSDPTEVYMDMSEWSKMIAYSMENAAFDEEHSKESSNDERKYIKKSPDYYAVQIIKESSLFGDKLWRRRTLPKWFRTIN